MFYDAGMKSAGPGRLIRMRVKRLEKFITRLKRMPAVRNSHLCVGLDSDYTRIPDFIKKGRTVQDALFSFNRMIIEETWDLAVAYKINVSFYSLHGDAGLSALARTNRYVRERVPETPILADVKRSEIGSAVRMVAVELFDRLGFDGVMVTPWFGVDTLKDFLVDDTKGVVVYVHDSNPSAVEIQDLLLADGRRVYEVVAEKVAGEWNLNGNVFAEGGATYPEALRKIRRIVGDEMPLLVAGVGPQGGTLSALDGLFGNGGRRLLVNSSRGVIFAGVAENDADYRRSVRSAAQTLRERLLAMAGGIGK
ncbi:MAG: orotidine-5'-phosphate decarboxylase [Synergistaceae bacterium]|jgi:orotidine-5'-phosphate decarboxylase|nr:orotidine-5'-phosphate decarboxylase [Synergistaceae bacterium]